MHLICVGVQGLGISSNKYNESIIVDATQTLGPLYTQAKSRDHEIVRAPKKCAMAIPRHFHNHVVWSRALKCSMKPYVTRALNRTLFQ